jgi:hypothetical protein
MLSFRGNSGVDGRVPLTGRLEWNGNARDDFSHGRFRFITADAKSVGLSHQANAVR